MRAVRFTKAEYELVLQLLSLDTEENYRDNGRRRKTAEAALAKLEAAQMPVKKATGLAIGDAIRAFRGVLGPRLVVPPSGGTVWGDMARGLAKYNLTQGDCIVVAKVAEYEWRGPIKAESLIRQADVLLQAAQQPMPWGDRPNAAPVELGDDEI